MYYQNPPSPPGPQAPQSLAAPQAAQPFLPPSPPSPPALPAMPGAPPSPQELQRVGLEQPKRPTSPGIHRGRIEPRTLRFFTNGVSRFRFHTEDPSASLISCVMFRETTASLPADALSADKRLELRGYSRPNNWVDRNGAPHADTDFVVTALGVL